MKGNRLWWLGLSLYNICLVATMNNVFLQTDLFHRKAAFVIKQKKLLLCFNMRVLIETNTRSSENWTVNHGVPVRLSILKQLNRYWQIMTISLCFDWSLQTSYFHFGLEAWFWLEAVVYFVHGQVRMHHIFKETLQWQNVISKSFNHLCCVSRCITAHDFQIWHPNMSSLHVWHSNIWSVISNNTKFP